MGNKLKKFDLDLSLLLAIVRKECLENNICIDFSQICYVPGIIGMTMKMLYRSPIMQNRLRYLWIAHLGMMKFWCSKTTIRLLNMILTLIRMFIR